MNVVKLYTFLSKKKAIPEIGITFFFLLDYTSDPPVLLYFTIASALR